MDCQLLWIDYSFHASSDISTTQDGWKGTCILERWDINCTFFDETIAFAEEMDASNRTFAAAVNQSGRWSGFPSKEIKHSWIKYSTIEKKV